MEAKPTEMQRCKCSGVNLSNEKQVGWLCFDGMIPSSLEFIICHYRGIPFNQPV